MAKKKNLKINKTEWFLLLTLFVVFTLTLFIHVPDGKLHVYFLDVGQGDGILVETPLGTQVLIDGGPDDEVIRQLSKVIPFYDRSIDMVVLTHPDSDHINGLIKVLERYDVGKIIESGIYCATVQCREWEKRKEKEGAENFFVSLGDEIVIEDDVRFHVFNPFEDLKDKEISKKNNSSIVLKLIYKDKSLLLTGDIEKSVENKLAFSGLNIDSDFLKIAHHGSNSSSVQSFLEKVSPLIAFIQVGENSRYGHPHPEVINRLEDNSISYYRTDIDGIIELVLGDNKFQIVTGN